MLALSSNLLRAILTGSSAAGGRFKIHIAPQLHVQSSPKREQLTESGDIQDKGRRDIGQGGAFGNNDADFTVLVAFV
ncbi:uncharacterized protein B0H18DRAFT_601404 [Fomitopsis serialis]|uniref:uncharacterized protein n=1 Tax=Fomitopsis serialis TaxID=139415 RepID=UPI0020088055|nr:uncharacterized protein B0H18DRAFT_601404 [Neoantrodia serialis]KAH9933790.1 hypothetical protein B0H18DRAFT_601404 [Neoantrodia serialis]